MGNEKNKLNELQHALNLQRLVSIIKNDFPKSQINNIIELGARDCNETISLNHFYPNAKVFTFECNPEKIDECREKVKNFSNIKLIEKAVSNQKGSVTFYVIDKENTKTTWEDGNPGASSLFEASGNYKVEEYAQIPVQVECTTLYNEIELGNIYPCDLLWMDIQGSELNALKGMKSYLQDVSFIHTEVEFMEIYKNQPLFWEIKAFLKENGFYLGYFTSFSRNNSGDAVFVNAKKLGKLGKLKFGLRSKLLHLLYHYGIFKS
jgi:FkbM family methyltransferase